MATVSTFHPKDDFTTGKKAQIIADFRAKGLNARYSGNTIKDKDGNIQRGPGFYVNKA
jgi:hypothetical protein